MDVHKKESKGQAARVKVKENLDPKTPDSMAL